MSHWHSTHRSSSRVLTRTRTHIRVLLGLTAVLFGLFTAYVIFSKARARIHPLIAELPYAAEDENGARRHAGDWADADVAERIPDDSPDPEGEVRL
ncbi:hypothetical protein D9619_010260 [Psilocybe cf. subviscida]|uniref:Uncharacterized protein n=1 Tax=Psilocybe cf. subviscida TaxID=2480587 RepID=A0A8H5AS97_9AGAR|nr:hypothetical protein D9619_010260 [Psilocybe cf. subviscida]